nr:hypothetical protein [Tanacetum cinerariifolium]
MNTTIDQQVAIDEALVPHARRLRIGRSNFRLLSDISSKESALQLVYYVLRLTPFFKAFMVTVDVLEIYMQEFLATTTVHHHSIRFKMDNKKHIVNLESFWEMLHICPRLPGQTFDEPPFEEESMAFLRSLGNSGAIRRLTDRNVDFTYLLWEDFVYQVKHKDTKKSNENYYPRDDQMFMMIKLVSRHQNTQRFSAMLPIELTNADIRNSDAYKEYYRVATGATPRKTKASVWKTKSSFDTTTTHPPTAVVGTRLFMYAKGKQPATISKAKSLTTRSEVAMTEAQQLKLETKRSLQQTHISQASGSGADEGIGSIPGVPDVPTEESDKEISWKSSDEGDDDDDDDNDQEDANKNHNDQEEGNNEDDQEEGNDDEQVSDEEGEEFIHPSISTHDEEEMRDEESFDPIPKTPKNTDDEGNGEENIGTNVGREEGHDEKDEEDELYRDVNINLGKGYVQTPTSKAPLSVSAPTLTPSTIVTVTTIQQAPTPPTTALSTLLQDLPNFGSLFGFDNRLKTLEANFFEFMQTNQFAGAVSSIFRIVKRYMDQRMNEAVRVAVQIQSDRLRDEAQAENDEFLKTIDENMQKIIKEQVKEQVKVQVSKILPKIKQTVNEKLEAEFLTRSSNSSKTSYDVAADLSEIELKKILIEKIKGNKSIHRSNEQMNLYKALVEAYESDKIILDTYGDTVMLKRRRDDDADKDEEPSVGSDRGSKRRREGKKPDESTKAEELMQTTHEMEEPSHLEFETGADDQPIVEPSQHPEWFSQQKKPPTPDRDWKKTLSATHGSIQPWISELEKIIAVTELKIVEWHNYKHLDWITNKDRQNRLMRIDELHKFSDGMLTDVRTALDDHLKGIRMKYLPQTIWRKSDKDRAEALNSSL